MFTGEEREYRTRKRPSTNKPQTRPIQQFFAGEPVKVFQIPTVAASYNDHMSHVDRGDQLRSYQGYDHALRRGAWQALAWTFLLDIVLVNSFILQQHGQPAWKKKTDQKSWRKEIINALFKKYAVTTAARKRFRSGDEFTPISQHKYINRGKNSDCLACKGRTLGEVRSQSSKRRPLQGFSNNIKRRQTRMGCEQCDVALCSFPDCWYKYHGQE